MTKDYDVLKRLTDAGLALQSALETRKETNKRNKDHVSATYAALQASAEISISIEETHAELVCKTRAFEYAWQTWTDALAVQKEDKKEITTNVRLAMIELNEATAESLACE